MHKESADGWMNDEMILTTIVENCCMIPGLSAPYGTRGL